jgi:hypothetical protein
VSADWVDYRRSVKLAGPHPRVRIGSNTRETWGYLGAKFRMRVPYGIPRNPILPHVGALAL